MQKKINKLLGDKDIAELLRGSGISFFLRIGGQALGFLLTFIIASYFGASALGDYILAIIVLRIFTLISKSGMDISSIRFISSFSSRNMWTSISNFRNKTINILCFTSIISSITLYYLSDRISLLINTPSEYIKASSLFVLPMSFFILNYQSLRGLKRIAEFSFFYRMSQALFTLIFILIIYQFSNDSTVPLYSYLSGLLIVSFSTFIVFRYWINRTSKEQKSIKIDIMSYSAILKVSIPLMFAQSVQFIMAWTDKLMLGAIDTPKVLEGISTNSEEVGIYHTAFKLSMFAAIALMSVNSIAAPKFAEIYARNDIKALIKLVHQSTKIIFWTSFPLVLIFFLFPESLLGIFGEEFKVGVTAFIFLSFGRLISSFSGSVGNILQMTGHQNIYSIILLIGAILNVGLNFILIPIYGINGAAIASMSSLAFWNLSMVVFVKRKLGFYTFYIPFIKR